MPGFSVTLTDADTNYNLLALVRDIDPAFIDRAKHLSLQADPDNTGTVLIGGPNLDDTRYGMELGNGEGKIYGDGVRRHQSLRGVWARSATAAQQINIEVR